MKIAQIACVFPPISGGIAASASRLSALMSAEHEVDNFHPGNLRPWLRHGHGAVLPQLLWRLGAYDYIYLHYPFFGTAEIVWLFKLLNRRTKLIIHYHMDVRSSGFLTAVLSWPARLIRRSLFNRAEYIITASLDYVSASAIASYYRRRPEKFREIPFGLDLKKFQPKALHRPMANAVAARAQEIINYVNEHFIKKSRLDLLFVGGLDRAHYFKGVDILFRALADLPRDRWRLKIVGDGDRRPHFEALAAALQLDRQIDFAGKLPDNELIRAYQNADVLLLPSTNSNEAFGLVLIEALACGVPVIASDLPGVRRVFANYREGLLVAPGDSNDLRRKINMLLEDDGLRRRLAQAARRLAEERYDEQLAAQKIRALFKPQLE